METPVFRVDRRAQDRLQILAPTGRITLGQNVKELRQAIDQVASEGHQWLLLDMTNVPYVDSAGLGAIVTGLNLFRKIDGDLLLANLQPRIAQLLELTNLNEVLKVFPSEQAAVDSIRTTAQASAL
jgi:anti-sigma B factor antagonist